MRTAALLLSIVTLAAGCASKPAGSAGYDAFLAESVPSIWAGPRPLGEAAQCFEERARFLPLSEFSRDSQAGTFTYRLRVSGLWFEQVRISANGPGSRAEARLSPHLDARWRGDFERDRTSVLRQCLGA
jgi:hypothetical protein